MYTIEHLKSIQERNEFRAEDLDGSIPEGRIVCRQLAIQAQTLIVLYSMYELLKNEQKPVIFDGEERTPPEVSKRSSAIKSNSNEE